MYFKGIKNYIDIIPSTQKPTGTIKGQNSISPLALIHETLNRNFDNALNFWMLKFLNIQNKDNRLLFSTFLEQHSSLLSIDKLDLTKDEKSALTSSLSKEAFPLDIIHLFDEMRDERNAILFAIAMIIKNLNNDFEIAVLSTINMGGKTTLTGGLVAGCLAFSGKDIPKRFVQGLFLAKEITSIIY